MPAARGARPEADPDLAAFSSFDPVPAEAIRRAIAIMQTGEIFRYCGSAAERSEVALLEHEFAAYLGVRYALGVNSCSAAIQIALAACGVRSGSPVLVPGFTFTAVPSAIVLVGAEPVFVECTDDYRMDPDDLERKITPETRVLLLSHMRGYAPDMDRVTELCHARGVTVIEDAAHALGARWRGRPLGSFGTIGCFSFQSNKIVNAGEGGMLATDDEELIVKAIYLSGSYEANYRKHGIDSPLFEKHAGTLPAYNARMTNVTAAMARPQLHLIDGKGARYRDMHAYLRRALEGVDPIRFPGEDPNELRVPDSIQFRLEGFEPAQMRRFIDHVRKAGIPIAGFAEPDNARAFQNWHYLNARPDLPRTARAIANACDLRLSLALTPRHLSHLVTVIRAGVAAARA